MQTQNTVPSTQNNVTTSKLTKWVVLTLSGAFLLLAMIQLIAPLSATTSGSARIESLQQEYDNTLSMLKDIERKRDTLLVNASNLECELAGEKLKNWDILMLSEERKIELAKKSSEGCGVKPVLK